MSRGTRTAVIVALVVGAGLVFIVFGALVQHEPYVSSLLSNLGTAALLVIPILLLERAFERVTDSLGAEVSNVQKAVKAVGDRLEEVSNETKGKVAANRASMAADERAPARAIIIDPSFSTLRAAFERAESLEVLDRTESRGGRRSLLRLSFLDMGFRLLVTLERPYGISGRSGLSFIFRVTPLDERPGSAAVLWTEEMSVETCFVRLDESIHKEWGDRAPRITPDIVLRRVASALEYAFVRKAAIGAGERWLLMAGLADGWFLTTEGIEMKRPDDAFELYNLDSDVDVTDSTEAGQGGSNLDRALWDEALSVKAAWGNLGTSRRVH